MFGNQNSMQRKKILKSMKQKSFICCLPFLSYFIFIISERYVPRIDLLFIVMWCYSRKIKKNSRSSMALRSKRFGVRLRKLGNVGQLLDGWPKVYYLELLRAWEGTLSRWSRLHLHLLAPTNPHWADVVGYGPFSLCVIYKEGLCPSSGVINRLMMIMMKEKPQ
jgi:hypothetical protein